MMVVNFQPTALAVGNAKPKRRSITVSTVLLVNR
jgi:hypothetical protein